MATLRRHGPARPGHRLMVWHAAAVSPDWDGPVEPGHDGVRRIKDARRVRGLRQAHGVRSVTARV